MRNIPKSLITISTAALGLPIAAMAQADPGDGRYYDHHAMMGWGGWILGPVMMLLILAFIVGAVIVVFKVVNGDSFWPGAKASDSASDILKKRFAKGELSREEYDTSRKVLDDRIS